MLCNWGIISNFSLEGGLGLLPSFASIIMRIKVDVNCSGRWGLVMGRETGVCWRDWMGASKAQIMAYSVWAFLAVDGN